MNLNPAQKLINFGQSVWYDNISREIIKNGELARLIREWGVRGITSNPTIFDQAISKGTAYNEQIASLKNKNLSIDEMFIQIALQDISEAADMLRPIYEESRGTDGFVSIEVSPLLARDTAGTIKEAHRLFKELARPNIMVKVPGTKEGIPAIAALLEEGINVNITLLFSVENYVEVAHTYIEALTRRAKKGLPVDKVRSVASFFVSRVDTLLDEKLQKIISSGEPKKAEQAKALLGKFGVANSKVAYERFERIFEGDTFVELKKKGAAVQRPLWASTGVKNPAYRDVMYVEELIDKDTVNTMPHATLQAFVEHGNVSATIHRGMKEAEQMKAELEALGVDVAGALVQLQEEGVKKFADSFISLNKAIEKKVKEG